MFEKIKNTYQNANYIIDTHTAVAAAALDKYSKQTGDNHKCVIMSTASPYKFARSVMTAIDSSYKQVEDFDLIDYDVFPGDEIWMYNYVKENGYNYAAVKCESNTGDDYSVGFLWSPDSV